MQLSRTWRISLAAAAATTAAGIDAPAAAPLGAAPIAHVRSLAPGLPVVDASGIPVANPARDSAASPAISAPRTDGPASVLLVDAPVPKARPLRSATSYASAPATAPAAAPPAPVSGGASGSAPSVATSPSFSAYARKSGTLKDALDALRRDDYSR